MKSLISTIKDRKKWPSWGSDISVKMQKKKTLESMKWPNLICGNSCSSGF